MTILLGFYSLVSGMVCRINGILFKTGFRRRRKAPLPVISIGNLTLGGSEKTPLARELLIHFLGLGRRPALVTRGYMGSWEEKGGVLSDGQELFGGWEEAGDEPYMIARHVPRAGIFVGKNRYRSCLKAKEMGFDLAVLDDGFQHIKLGRDVDIVLYDPTAEGGRREGPSALGRADIILVRTGGEAALRRIRQRFSAAAFEYAVVPRGLRLLETGEPIAAGLLQGKRILAFCGIARPERFFSLLVENGLPPQIKMPFPDHFPYPPPGLGRIAAACEKDRIEALLTTEKDAVKLLGRTRAFASTPLYVLDVGLDLPPAFFEKIGAALGSAGPVDDPNRSQAARPS